MKRKRLKYKRVLVWYRYKGGWLKKTGENGMIRYTRVPNESVYGYKIFVDLNSPNGSMSKWKRTTACADIVNLDSGEVYLSNNYGIPEWLNDPMLRAIAAEQFRNNQKKKGVRNGPKPT